MKNKRHNLPFFKSGISLLIGYLFLLSTLTGQETNKSRLTENWEYVKGDLGSAWEVWRGEKNVHLEIWSSVQLPHCFNSFDAVDSDAPYYQGPGWYKTLLEVNNKYENGRVLLHFEGAGQKTDVYVYTEKVGSHVGGYDEFIVDITEAVNKVKNNKELTDTYKGKIPIVIRCDNTRDIQMIPSDLSDFNIYGGLYRYVNLVYAPAVYAERVYVTSTMDLSSNKAKVNVSAKLYKPNDFNDKVEVSIQIRTPDDKIIKSINKSIISWKEFKDILSFEIKNPQLWSPDSPALYECNLTLKTSRGEHTISEKFGVRHFEFVNKGPFKLNGERLLLRGTHRHEDHAGTAAAMTEDMIIQEMKMMKEMGVNFIRLGHYQQSRIVLEQCDKLGILVWEEIPWCRGGLGNETYKEQARRMLRNMIDQHRNHPSIIIWGLGNENDWPGDFEYFDTDSIRAFMQELHNLSHLLDDSRKTAIRRCDFCKDIVDVYSPSIWAGWYRGVYTRYKEVSKKEMEGVNHFLHVEWGASNHARRHSELPDKGLEAIANKGGADERSGDFLMTGGDPRVSKDGDWSETYACNLIDWHLKEQENMPWLTGAAYWPFKDFSTPIRPENPVPFVNQKGVVERDFTKKEGYYVFQSYWTEKPMAHIYGHSWPNRWGNKNENKMVKVYSNCPEAELYLNGEALGTKKRDSQNFPAAGLRWIVKFQNGENHLKVIAKKQGQEVIDEIIVNYQIGVWEQPNNFIFETKSQKNDTALLCVKSIDKNGLICLDAKNQVHFQLSGDGKLIDNLGTSIGSNKIQLYNGLAMIKVKLNHGNSVVSVSSEGIPTEFLKLVTSDRDVIIDNNK